jgi:hypothetical protein
MQGELATSHCSEMGCDHRAEPLYAIGIGIARKGWLTKSDVVNCLPSKKSRRFFAKVDRKGLPRSISGLADVINPDIRRGRPPPAEGSGENSTAVNLTTDCADGR